MRRFFSTLLTWALLSVAVYAQDSMYVHQKIGSLLKLQISNIDSITFRNPVNVNLQDTTYVYQKVGGVLKLQISNIDSFSFTTTTPTYSQILSVPKDTTICFGSDLTLYASGGLGNFNWSSPDPIAQAALTSTDSSSTIISGLPIGTYTFYVRASVPLYNAVIDGGFTNFNTSSPTFQTKYTYLPNLGNTGEYDVVVQQFAYGGSLQCPLLYTGIQGDNVFFADGIAANNVSGTAAAGTVPYALNNYAWQNANRPVLSQANYKFRMKVANWGGNPPAQMMVLVNGQPLNLQVVDSSTSSTIYSPSDNCNWHYLQATWNSGSNTSATITISEVGEMVLGHDFVLDNISFGIDGYQMDTIHVTVNNCFTVTATADTTSPCIGTSTTLKSVTNGFVTEWVNMSTNKQISTNATISVSPTVATTYQVTSIFPVKTLNKNGGFEDGTLNSSDGQSTGFTYSNNDNYEIFDGEAAVIMGNESWLVNLQGSPAQSSITNLSGSSYMFLTISSYGNNTKVLFSQTVPVTNGNQYGVSFYLKNVMANLANSAPVDLAIRINGTVVYTLHNPLNNNWNYYSYVWIATGTTATIDIVGLNTYSTLIYRQLALDNITIGQAGMPQTDSITITPKTCP